MNDWHKIRKASYNDGTVSMDKHARNNTREYLDKR